MSIFNEINFNEVQETGSFELIPAGLYNVIIIEAGSSKAEADKNGLEPLKSGKGKCYPVTLEIIDGECSGRKLFQRFNIIHQNEDTRRIALQQLKQMLTAIGWDFNARPTGPDDASEITNIPFCVQVAIKQDKNTGENRNEIKSFRPRTAAMVTTIQRTAPAATAQPKRETAPWARLG